MKHYQAIANTLRGIAETLEGLAEVAQDGTRFGATVSDELAELAHSVEHGAREIAQGPGAPEAAEA